MAGVAADLRSDDVVVAECAASVDDIARCNLLFVPQSEDAHLSAILAKISGKSVLTVGETDGFPWAGGIIRFFQEDNHIRFEVNLAAADSAALKISSRLLKLARIFKGN